MDSILSESSKVYIHIQRQFYTTNIACMLCIFATHAANRRTSLSLSPTAVVVGSLQFLPFCTRMKNVAFPLDVMGTPFTNSLGFASEFASCSGDYELKMHMIQVEEMSGL